MNNLSVERLLSLLQMALLPIAIFIILLGIAFEANAATDENKPSMELLEFLGEWQTKDGEWVDPMRFLNVSEEDLEKDPFAKVNVNEVTRDD
jgi:UDP-N-acetyl-D-mannosaminuronate dehydrogenase